MKVTIHTMLADVSVIEVAKGPLTPVGQLVEEGSPACGLSVVVLDRQLVTIDEVHITVKLCTTR